jgi:predicted TPR repeat methyltransferase
VKKNRAKSARSNRSSPVEDLDRGIQACLAGRLPEAEKLCRSALSKSPGLPQALHVLGVVRFKQGDKLEAVAYLQEAIERDPEYAPAYNDLGNTLHELGRIEESIACFRRLNELQPDQPSALNNLAVILKDHDRVGEAIELLRRATALDPTCLSAHLNLAYSYIKHDCFPEAIEVFQTATRIAPEDSEPLRMLAQLYRQAGDDANTVATYERWQVVEPNCEIPRHMLSAFHSPDGSSRATEAFVRDEFDRFADSFDKKLAQLKYRAPELVLAEVARRYPQGNSNLEILDAGCGTGQGGVLLRPFSKRLVGVDLSAGMLAYARRAGVYDELFEQDLVTFLQEHPNAFDLITVIDTLIYFGDLLPPLTESFRALRAGGCLIFTAEATNQPIDYQLARTGRYVHGQDYLSVCMKNVGFAQHEISSVQLREERGEPVWGYLICGTRA